MNLDSSLTRHGLMPPMGIARITGSDSTETGQSLANIAGLTLALAASSVYDFEASMTVTTSAVTSGIQYGIQFTGSGSSVEAWLSGSSTTTADKSQRISALNTPTGTYMTGSGQSGRMLIKGTLFTGDAGNLTIQHLKVTSGTSTVRIGSTLKAIKIG